ncbi:MULTISPECIES: ABC transporter ATP-binding protein [Streptomyces]|uniref:ABC transporter ATP-binding protein n=2 Tax=Streptomyces rimosus subsp. rimosus TaxID=132474 RepID=L8EIW3_STRR1|nr:MULTISPECIES: ABC transporter ATP-binding protein [Streptomyces]KOG74637.1 ABC transporter ATP-binding protein [Kitasatospora aureofaciens]MYT43212.1 ATP-binding cassette domain-containing protein [Streptomyces sp. SID5471]KEF03464.1 ABC transporter ATP-binding protein [Streptomyces rimosus]KOT45143.1 ABC transporter ATP-binding protein [Streptomyces rimosus subsp. rimosus]KOT46241.1 ABC transporter ATP-binding protein [Streptomyces sp. NRRL WC-3701]
MNASVPPAGTRPSAGLALTGVTLTYPDGAARLTALDDVSLTVPAGSVTAVVGPSGSGKSSLLAVAATLIAPDRGRVVIDGTDTAGMGRAELTALRRTRVGMVFQQPNLLPSLTAVEQVQVMAHLDGKPVRAARERALELLDAVGLADQAGRRPHQLSGGQRQRVNIARALMNEPAVLLVDEPTSALDHERGAAVLDLITTLTHRRGTATVLVTHDRAHLEAVDAVADVRDGRLSSRRSPLPRR